MELRLIATRDDKTGIRLKSYALTGGVERELKASESYSKYLLILFARYKAFAAASPATADTFILSSNANEEAVTKLTELYNNSKKKTKSKKTDNTNSKKRRDPREHTCYRLIHDPLNGHPEPRELITILPGKAGIQFSPGLLAAKEIKILLDGNTVPLDDAKNVDPFLECLEMCTPENEGILDSGAIRQDLDYTITFDDSPTVPQQNQFRPALYRYFHATLNFKRLSFAGCDHFTVNLVQADAEEMPDFKPSTESSNLVYREVFSVEKDDAGELARRFHDMVGKSPDQCRQLLSEVFEIEATVNTLPVQVTSVTPSKSEYCLRYDLPEELRDKLRLNFLFTLNGFRARAQSAYPIFTSEVTKGASLRFNCRKTDIAKIGYFLGAKARLKPGREELTAGWDKDLRGFWMTCPKDHYLFPGEGAVVHWMHVERAENVANAEFVGREDCVERVDYVELVDLSQKEWGVEVAPALVGPEGAGSGSSHGRGSPCLVRQTAEKLRKVANKLRQPGLHRAIKVWDAYRTPSVESRLAGSEKGGYVCNMHSSAHSRGCAVDVTLVDHKGNEIAMPTSYMDGALDSRRSTIDAQDPSEAQANYQLLKTYMLDEDFEAPDDAEWWHFVDRDWRKHPVLSIDAYSNTQSKPTEIAP